MQVFEDASFAYRENDFAVAFDAFADKGGPAVFFVAGNAAKFLHAEFAQVAFGIFQEVFFDDKACDV